MIKIKHTPTFFNTTLVSKNILHYGTEGVVFSWTSNALYMQYASLTLSRDKKLLF